MRIHSPFIFNVPRFKRTFTRILDTCEAEYVIVSGYVAILTGRSRSTKDIDVILESLSETETEQLVTELKNQGYWGMAMPLDEMY